MKQAQLVARADEQGVYIAARNGRPAKFYKHDAVTTYTPEKKSKPNKALEMAYKSFVYARGRFTPGGMDKYLQFRNNENKPRNTQTSKGDNINTGAVLLVNTVIRVLGKGPSHGNFGTHIHRFQQVRA